MRSKSARYFDAPRLAAHFVSAVVISTVSLISAQASAGPGHGKTAKQGHHSQVIYGTPGKASDVSRTIRVTTNDATFSLEKLKLKRGETIRFIVTNKSEIDHDFTIGDTASQAAHRREMEQMMERVGMEGMMGHDDANAVFLKPGKTKELIWKFNRPGRFEFACNVPGHYEAGMKGSLLVAAKDLKKDHRLGKPHDREPARKSDTHGH